MRRPSSPVDLCCLVLGALLVGGCGDTGGEPLMCVMGQTACGGRCTNLNGDIRNCGACGNVCVAGEACSSAVCVPVPDGGRADTGVDTGTTPDMGVAPDMGRSDSDTCAPICTPFERCCGATCVNRASDTTDGREDSSFDHCGSCGAACDPSTASTCAFRSGAATCVCGRSLACSGSESCVPNGDGFRCSDLDSDPMNCGEVGRACREGETCEGGECACGDGAACGGSQACCDGTCTDTSSSLSDCGGCGIACGAGTSCEAGSCQCPAAGRACRRAVGDDLGELCCASGCVPQDESNCRTCGMTCPARTMCIEGGDFGEPEFCCAASFGGLPPACPPRS